MTTIIQPTAVSEDMRLLLAESDAYHAALYPTESNHMTSAEDLLSDDFAFFLLFQDDTIAGSIGLNQSTTIPEIKRLFVRHQFRGMGYGKKLLTFILDHCREAGHARVRLETGIHQPESIGLYTSAGFTEIAPFPPYEPDPLSKFFERTLSD